MAHYAFINADNIVTEVIVGRDENELPDGIVSWEVHYGNLRGQTCKRTSFNTRYIYEYELEYGDFYPPKVISRTTIGSEHSLGGTPFRGTYAGIGYTYDADADVFVAPPTESDTDETEL